MSPSTSLPRGGWVVGIDVGGTFTDIVAVHAGSGERHVAKIPSTPGRPASAMVEGLHHLLALAGIPAETVGRIAHGTTVATNALIQGSGARLALVTTEGFRDVLEIGRQVRPHMFDLYIDPPPPLVPRERRLELGERITADGSVRRAPDPAAIAAVVEAVRQADVEACAVCFLFAFRNPAHEAALRDALHAALPDLPISLSSEVHPEFREYERFSTTVINAYVQPVMAGYLRDLAAGMAQTAPGAAIGINQSSGGLMSLDRAIQLPVRTALSGPAAGVVGAIRAVGARHPDLITLDMGGTSADVSLVRDRTPGLHASREVEGYPVRLPALDITAVGAGGGSIAWIDRDGLLKVGPQSAGARPGPACYGRGGTLPTVSDANLVLGRLSPSLADGGVRLDVAAAQRVIATLAARLGLTSEATALGVIRIVNSNMVRAIRRISVERGHDPRQFDLVPFGGAGPLHAAEVARSLGIRRMVVPHSPGLLCAEGLLGAEQREDFVQSVLLPLRAESTVALAEGLAALARRTDAWFLAEGVAPGRRRLQAGCDLRYVGQNFELTLPITDWPARPLDQLALHQAFCAMHERSYGFQDPLAPVEVVNLRFDAVATNDLPPAASATARSPIVATTASRAVLFEAMDWTETPVLRRETLRVGEVVLGPMVLEQLDATILLAAGDRGQVDDVGNLVVDLAP
ncbi:hydantoinase/oxoprolinase family protein [Humitalea sp. 24SJ18S-53]|uniref:hydantoinase/oxoprolinase family protein n=1 Tax=Humitalea sp. 24SJ18S-53 TaxID=3422307 RepID=UPI003D67F8D5